MKFLGKIVAHIEVMEVFEGLYRAKGTGSPMKPL